MLQLIQTRQSKPNRIETREVNKDEKYHVDYARWIIGEGLRKKQQDHVAKYRTNMNFYKDKQWIMKEDTEAFFKDESGQDRNRIKVTRNFIQPMVEQYRGNAERMTFDVKVQAISPMAKSRRDKSLARLQAYGYAAEIFPEFGAEMEKQGYLTGKDEDDIAMRFENTYVDNFVIAMNRLLRYVAKTSRLDRLKKQLAVDIATGGIGVVHPFPLNGEWQFKRIPVDRFGWDRGAEEEDLSDSEYFYEFDYTLATAIYERHQNIKYTQKQAIEHYVSQIVGTQATGQPFDIRNRVPIYNTTWRDTVVDTFGYVTDQFGQRILERLNYIYEGEEEPRYTQADVIPLKDLTPYQKKVLRGKSTRGLQVDLWRFCRFIPYEIISAAHYDSSNTVENIVLDYGIIPYQEPDLYMPTNMKPPYKCGTWSYMDGETMAPIDVVINPQRMINRFMSVMENQINNAGGAGIIFDKDLFDIGQEDEVAAKMKRSEPIGVRGRARGVSNAVGRYDAGIKESTLVFSQLIENFRLGIEQISGVNEGLKGQQNPDQLVGVMQLAIQRGSIMQEPFYAAINSIFNGCYQNIATSGKRYYIDMDVELVDAVGEESAEILKISKDMRHEQFRTNLVRTVDPDSERVYVDQRTLSWLQYGLIDAETAAILTGRATDEEALAELRAFHRRLAELKRKQAQAAEDQVMVQNQAQEQTGQVLYQEKLRDEAREDSEKDKDRATKIISSAIKPGANK
jgi:hypothetical protein